MRIPQDHISIAGVRLQNNRLQPPEGATQEVRDAVSLANRELEANDRLIVDLRSKDNSSADLDSRAGSVRLVDYSSAATGDRKFTQIALDGDKLSAQAPGRNENSFDCRQVDGTTLDIQADYGKPGAIPGLSFRTYAEYGKDTLHLKVNFSRPEMVMRMTRDDLREATASIPELVGVDTKLLGKQLAAAHGRDFMEIQNEFSKGTINALETNLGMVEKGPLYCGGVGLVSFLAAQANMPALAVGLFVGGLGAGYAATKYLDHKASQGFKAGRELGHLQSYLEKNATELPPSVSKG